MWTTTKKKKHSRNKDAPFDFLAIQYRSRFCPSGVMQRNKWCGSESFYSKLRGKHAVIFDALCRTDSSEHVGITCKKDVQWWRLPFELKTTPRGARRSYHWTNSSFSSGEFMTPDLLLSWRQFHVCDCDLDILLHTSSYNSTSNATRISAITTPPPLLHQPPQGLPSYLVVHRVKHWKSAELFGCGLYQIAIISDAAVCLQRCTGAKMDALAAALLCWAKNKTLRLTVCLKMDSCATCRYVWGTLIIHLMPFKHGTAWQVCLWWRIPSVPVYARACVCVQQCLCLCG